jgi:pimeloyl-ACP methyl ester carboxylesterase
VPDQGLIPYLRRVSELAGIAVGEPVEPLEGRLHADGLSLHYLDWGGDGPPVVFLHGGGQTAHTWDVVCLALRDRYRCLALDLRGHGDSDWSPDLDYGIPAHACDAVAAIDALACGSAVVVGMSLGGLSALWAASASPDRFRALAVIDAAPNVPPGRGREILDFLSSTAELRTLDEYVERALAFNPRRDPELLRTSLLFNLRERRDGGFAPKYDRRHLNGAGADRERWERAREELWDRVASLRVPTLLVRGAASRILLPEEAEELVGRMPNARWVEVPNAGHTVQGDNPAGLLRELEPFLAEAG